MFLLLTFICGFKAHGAVWTATKSWDETWQSRYAAWVANTVTPNYFKELGRPYSNLKMDCADAHYALLAYFSYINGLEFSAGGGAITNNTSRFDHIANHQQRLAAFMDFLSGSYGTESLVHQDTYPIAIRDVRPGDLFMYKIGTNGNYTRHSYIVKNINLDGTFDVMYSTQARRDAGQPLTRQKSYMFTKAPTNTGGDANHWGFRRSKMPQHASISQERLALSDFSQYELARRLGRLEFFREVKRIHQSVNESPNMVIGRNFNTVCSAAQDRVSVVKSALSYVAQVGGRCLNEQEFDAYSTPSRDSGIMDNYRNFAADFDEVVRGGHSRNIDPSLNEMATLILGESAIKREKINEIYTACPIKTGVGGVDLASFKRNLFAHRVSFHPNDNEFNRWGYVNSGGRKTSCKAYYGYPVN